MVSVTEGSFEKVSLGDVPADAADAAAAAASAARSASAQGSGSGGGGLLPEHDEPPAPVLANIMIPPAPAMPAGRQISALSERTFSDGSFAMFGELMYAGGALKRGVSESSFLSEFEVVTQGGRTHRRCKRCSHLNPDGAMVCQGCEAGLIASLDIDEQIARNLQLKEEQAALGDLEEHEAKRQKLDKEGLLVQAQYLSHSVIQVVQQCKDARATAVPDLDLTLNAARFIQTFKEDFRQTYFAGSFSMSKVSLTYTYTNKELYLSILQNGFPAKTKVSDNREAALRNLDGLPRKELHSTTMSQAEMEKVGWIVAIVVGEDNNKGFTEEVVLIPDEATHARIWTLEKGSQCLPLACFDSTTSEELVTRLFKLLCTNVTDFFSQING